MINHSVLETPEKNHIATAPSAPVLFVPDTIKYQKNTTTHITRQKLPPSGKEYLCFQMDYPG